MSEHRCDTGHFDRSICPEPCGTMHSFCSTCGERQDACAHEADSTPTERERVLRSGNRKSGQVEPIKSVEAPLAAEPAPTPTEREGVAEVLERLLPLNFNRHSSETVKDAARRDRHVLALRLSVALAPLIAERERRAAEVAWEKGRQHYEKNFISCPDDNPYGAARIGDTT